ncbi:pyruvate, phosphate dikinase [Bartonella sp. TP]|uniref:pyruvate, phosphate dikinase n=1 Tax=Bartonella sp. TP TaxID=3057550 RepID=UPI0025B25A73|nr:pyruvate, phosphate dikinase [Bartonella sp. TP]WJW80180.1 pyruvate, phosphate dikinase [Bartonella sp. TP]
MAKWVYKFGDGEADGTAEDRNLLGGKGANLAEMCRLGLPVPPGFTLTTEVCGYYYNNNFTYPEELRFLVSQALTYLENKTGRGFGSVENPLLLSVRSGARTSMPGMMDTVLNLGLNDSTVEVLAAQANPRFAYDSYRRFIQMYSNVVLSVEHDIFEDILEQYKEEKSYELDTQMQAQDWKNIVLAYRQAVQDNLARPFPQDPLEQLWGAIGAVFASWMTPRAVVYRRLHNIPQSWGTAVNVQSMVFGNMGDDCATGVAFTRNPSTGEKELYGEFLVNAQGEDVVAGIRTPQILTEKSRKSSGVESSSLEKLMPQVFEEFSKTADILERHYRDMQDLEFTIEKGKLWMLQARNGKRTAKAALRIAVDMYKEGHITKEEALLNVDAKCLDQLLHPCIDPDEEKEVFLEGLPASPGAATGAIVFSSAEAEKAVAEGQKVILVRVETSPEDIHGMNAAEGILTTRGGMTSHAAVVARGMGKPCVCGANGVKIDYAMQVMQVGDRIFKAGDIITLDGSTGQVIKGEVAMHEPELDGDFALLMQWADEIRRMDVRANAETVVEAKAAVKFGAQGIGLCRTEHMFFAEDRINVVREMILANSEAGRKKALDKLLPMQRGDFIQLFEVMQGMPLTIRLLDPPLHEFLPKETTEIVEIAAIMQVDVALLEARAIELHEFNPMLGLRGCRLAIAYPEIARCQARAIFEAACEAALATGKPIEAEIMVPLIATKAEFDYIKKYIDEEAQAVMQEKAMQIPYIVGTMIELPRAALCANDIAKTAEFFSFGTNDLTQTTFGISRDDAAPFLATYIAKNLLPQDPFVSIDIEGVGALIQMAAEQGRRSKAGLKLGICGEHGGDPDSIMFCEKVGLDYVSCSPFRVPVARLAAAQAAIKLRDK